MELDFKKNAEIIFKSAINEVKGENLIFNNVFLENNLLKICDLEINLSKFKNLFIIGAGKASAFMASALEKKLYEHITDGVVIVKDGHKAPCEKILVLEGAHPVIDERAFKNSDKLLKICENASKDDLVIALISGGASALLEKLPEKISLKELKGLSEVLLKIGANITEINTVRKEISLVKGGGLARLVYPGTLVSLIVSDVIHDRIDIVSSGPTVKSDSTPKDAIKVLEKYGIKEKTFPLIFDYLKIRLKSKNIQKEDKYFENTSNIVIGNSSVALKKAKSTSNSLGYETIVLAKDFDGESNDLAKIFSDKIKKELLFRDDRKNKKCFLAAGEPIIKVTGPGKGGRNQHLALKVLQLLENIDLEFYFCSVGTDGTDGSTDAAGAFINHKTFQKAKIKNLSISKYLNDYNSYAFFDEIDGLIKTGPTGTNVVDLMICLV